MIKLWDIAVVGAGPAGSVTALLLARAGLRVALYDKASFPRRKVCGCCLNGRALSALALAGLNDLPTRLGAVPLTHTLIAANGRTAKVRLPDGVAISREAFDTALIQEAEAAGAIVRLGTKVKLSELRASGWELIAGGEAVSAKMVIDATGLNGQLTASDTAISLTSRIGAGTAIASSPAYPAGVIHMATGAGGYVGLVRVEDGRLDVAAAFDPQLVKHSGGLGPAAEQVLQASGLPSVPGLTTADWKGTPPLTRTPRAVAGPRWFAIGDATGYVEPFTGEGMAWALTAAVAVVPLVQEAVTNWSDAHTRLWSSTHHRVVTRRQTACRLAARILRSPSLCTYIVHGLNLLPALAVPVVKLLNHPLSRVH